MKLIDEMRKRVERSELMTSIRDEMLAYIDAIEVEEIAERNVAYNEGYDAGFASADDWLADHEDAIAEHGWVKLPRDAQGEVIRIGDVVIAQLLFGGESKPLVVDRMELSRGRDGDLWYVALDNDKECWNQPSTLRHHHPPTVEDVLREFADLVRKERIELATISEDTIAEYAKRLRLAGEGE